MRITAKVEKSLLGNFNKYERMTLMNNKMTFFLALAISLAFFAIAGTYFMQPANHLPTFFPGYSSVLTKHHTTHAVAAAGLGLVVLAAGWMMSGKKATKTE